MLLKIKQRYVCEADSTKILVKSLTVYYSLAFMLLLANLAIKNDAKNLKHDWIARIWVVSSESTQRELSNEYQHDKV